MPKVSAAKTSFVNPANLSFTSTSEMSSPEPESQPGPSRKRPRTEQSSEERKEARAHRNRIAAQNSRDRRKAQFTYLEQRVAELEEENRQLRAGMGIPPAAPAPAPVFASPPAKSSSDEARERENEELKERIRTLEKGWDAVVKALAAQGLPTGVAPSSHTDSVSSSSPSVSTPSTVTTSSPSPSTTFSSSTSASLPSIVTLSSTQPSESSEANSRHLAAGVPLFDPYRDSIPATSSLEAISGSQDASPVDDATMESLFHEIISESESSPAPQAHSELASSLTKGHSNPGLSQSKDPLSKTVAAHTATAIKEEMTSEALEGDRRMSVSGMSLGRSSGSSAVGVSETGSMETDELSLSLSYDHLENDMMDLGNYIGESVSSSETSVAWSDIGTALEAFLDTLPGTQDLTDSNLPSGLWETLEGRVGLV
jgi:hypothetical protein